MSAEKKNLSRWLKLLLGLICAGAVCFSLLLGAVLYGSCDHIQGQPQTMIVLGCQVNPWGPSVLLRDRLDEAFDYLQKHPQVTVIVSGGQGADEPVSEAQCMRDYLVERGIDAGRIHMEDTSHNTYENLTNSAQLMQTLELDTHNGVILVSNGFHLTRARLLWGRVTGQRANLSTLAAPSSHAPSRLWMYVREPLALVKSFLMDG
ncbi:MAG: YdcF family protein [Oscillospiraceae bacterium]|nr:YdcF family protein [Oscillospiraceae bacterium]